MSNSGFQEHGDKSPFGKDPSPKSFDRQPSNKAFERQPTKRLEKQPTKRLENEPIEDQLNVQFERPPSNNLSRKPSNSQIGKNFSRKPTVNIDRDRRDLVPIEEVHENLSPRKHVFLNDLTKKNTVVEGGTNEPQMNNLPAQSNPKEEEGIFSGFFNKFLSKKEETQQPTVGQLTKNQIEQSSILREIYNDDAMANPKEKGKPVYSRLLTNLNDIMEPDQVVKPHQASDLENFLNLRNSTAVVDPPQQLQLQHTESIHIGQPVISQTRSFYDNQAQPLLFDNPKPNLSSSLTPYQPSHNYSRYNNFNYQPTVRQHMSNEEVKDYLKRLDSVLGESLKKKPRPSYDDSSSYYKAPSYRTEEPMPMAVEKSRSGVIERGIYDDNEELSELRDKYANSNAMQKSCAFLKKNANSMELSAFTNAKIGDIFCANCEEFISQEDLEHHAKFCSRKIEDKDLKHLNQKIEKIKYLLIINFKNVESSNKLSYIELEALMNIGIVILDEILLNNKSERALNEKTNDLLILIRNLPTLKNRNSNVFKVLMDRAIQLSSHKRDVLHKIKPDDKSILKVELPKKAQLIKRIMKSDGCCGCGGCCGCCEGSEKVVYETVPPKITNKKN